MRNFLAPAAAIILLTLALGAQQPADWRTARTLPGVDFTGLDEKQQTQALESMRKEACTCGCGMTVAQCRVVDPPCGDSRALAASVLKGVREQKSAAEIHDILVNSPLAKARAGQQRILGDPVKIPVDGAPVRGPANARITLVEFSDFECPYCAHAVAEIDKIMAANPKDVKLIYKQFPLDMHPHARAAALASLAAQEQGKFWEMHDKLFANARQLSDERIAAIAQEIGLNMMRFRADSTSEKLRARLNRDIQDGDGAGVQGTPSVFIDGMQYRGALTPEALKPVLAARLK